MSAWRPIVNAYPAEPTASGRVLGVVGGTALLALFVPGAAIVLFGLAISAQSPNARVPDGDPCCPHPDDWLAAVGGTAAGLICLAVLAVVLGVAIALIFQGLTGRPFGKRRLVRTAVGAPLAYGSLVLFALSVEQ